MTPNSNKYCIFAKKQKSKSMMTEMNKRYVK